MGGAIISKVLQQPIAKCLSRVTTFDFLLSLLHIVEYWEERHVAIPFAKTKCTLSVERVADYVRIREHTRRTLLDRICPQFCRCGQLQGTVKVLLPQFHDLKTSIDISQLNRRSVIEKHILRTGLRVRALELLTLHTEYSHSQTARPWLLVCLKKDRFISISCRDIVDL